MKSWIVGEKEAGQRLNKFMKWRLPKAPDSFFYKMGRRKNLVINDQKCKGDEVLKAGDCVKLYVSDDTIALFSDTQETEFTLYLKAFRELKDVTVIKETEDFLFLFKPSGVLSQKSKPQDLSLNDWLIGYLYDSGKISEESFKTYHPTILNRLDRNTAGLVFCAKNTKASIEGSKLLREHSVGKFYHCIVDGECDLEGRLEGYLYKDAGKNKSEFIRNEKYEKLSKEEQKKYDPVSLSVKPLKKKYGKTLLEIQLHTGKSHQIRVMLAENGFPIAGDIKYNSDVERHSAKDNKGNSAANSKDKAKSGSNPNMDAQLLCAVRMEFPEDLVEFEDLRGAVIACEAPFSLENFKI